MSCLQNTAFSLSWEKTLQHSLNITPSDNEDLCWETSYMSSTGFINWTIPVEYNAL